MLLKLKGEDVTKVDNKGSLVLLTIVVTSCREETRT